MTPEKKVTQHYVGVKIIQAWPQEKDGKPGYGVKYSDDYASWSPKDVFERSYLPMGEANQNKVTEGMVNAFTGREFEASNLDEKTTLVKCKTATGFTQYETSSCVDPENYAAEIGADICLDRIKNTIWKCLGFVVQWGRFGLKAEVGSGGVDK